MIDSPMIVTTLSSFQFHQSSPNVFSLCGGKQQDSGSLGASGDRDREAGGPRIVKLNDCEEQE